MLSKVSIVNFRCLSKVEVPLRPLTVLIGENDTGKSVFLRALTLLAAQDEPFRKSDHWRYDANKKPILTGSIGERSTVYKGNEKQRAPDSAINPVARFALPAQGLEMKGPGHKDDLGPPVIGSEGQHLPALLDYLLRNDQARFGQIVDALRTLIPGLERVAIPTPTPAERQIDLIIENGFRIGAQSASAGLRLLVFFVALAYHPTPPKLILVEEPENGIHPKRLQEVMKLLRGITQGEHASPAQVILTTHSPYLLDFVDVEQDQVLVFRRLDDGSRIAEPVDADRLKIFLDEFKLGEVWYNEGEKGLMANRP